MPIYDFKCAACGHEFEKITSFQDILVPCPVCARDAKKQISAPKLFTGLPMGNGNFDKMNSKGTR